MKILIPLDFSDNSVKALEFAKGLCKKGENEIILLHVVEVVYDFASQAAIALDNMHKDAREMISKLKKKHEHDSINYRSIIKEGTASISIARIAEEEEVDMIIMGTHGVSGIKKVLVGSTAVEVIKEARTPVLLIPSEGKTSSITKITLALEISNHEEEYIHKVVGLAKKWELSLEILHFEKSDDFREKLAEKGLQVFLKEEFPDLKSTLISIKSKELIKGLDQYFDDKTDSILAMCHQHKSLWEQVTGKSRSLEMAYHTHVPLLVML